MTIRIKNWPLCLLALALIGLFIHLGLWQLSRARQKEALLATYAERVQRPPLTTLSLQHTNDWRFYRITLHGQFDNAHTVLLDNKTFHGRIGYEIYTPFKASHRAQAILVDRGFVTMGKDRDHLPMIQSWPHPLTITGLLNVPPRYVAFGPMSDGTSLNGLLRVEFIDLSRLAALLSYPLSPYILNLTPNTPAAYAIEWQIVTMRPEQHRGYAVQWFAFALTLLILLVVLNTGRSH